MNSDTGIIQRYTPEELDRQIKSGQRLVAIQEELMTEKQRANMAVSLNDNRSELGKQLHAARSKYMPHVGAKEHARGR